MTDRNRPLDYPQAALVTGGSRRIGAAISRSLAAAGINLAVHHHESEDEAETLCAELCQTGIRAEAVQADLTDPRQARDLFRECNQRFGRLALLVNNASVFEPDTVLAPDDRLWANHFAIHVQAPSILASELAKQKDMNNGLVVNIIDQRVLNPNPTFYSYTLSKSALWMATKTMAQSLAPAVRVNGIGPGPTLPNDRQDETDFNKQVAGLLLERSPDLAEFGETILWMWRASSLTGQMIALDGGQHLGWQTPDVHGIRE